MSGRCSFSCVGSAIALAVCLLAGWSSTTWLSGAEVTATSHQMLAVLTDGRIMRGNITRHAAGYYVERPGGTIFIPSEQVRCVARDLQDAYRQQREQMLDPTAAMLIQLAEWCISYRLYDEAGDELRRALRRDPQNETARRMLARLDDMLSTKPLRSVESARRDVYGVEVADVESLGGLSKDLAAEFTNKIQPLIMNKCGNAYCHGTAAENEFRLQHVRIGSANQRLASQRNLALLLKYVDVAQPEQSPLLTKTRGAHGGTTFALFSGASGAVQQELFTSWVTRVAEERQTEQQKLARRTPLKAPGLPTTPKETSAIQLASAEQSAPLPVMNTGQPPRRLEDLTTTPDAEQNPRPVPRFDPFDPAEFNRQFATPGMRR